MTGKKITYAILAAFIAGNLLLIYIQYNSAKNVDRLIKGNEKLLVEFDMSSNLSALQRDINLVENKIGKSLYTKDSSHLHGIREKMEQVESDLKKLHQISDDVIYLKYINKLDFLVREKLMVNRQISNAIRFSGGDAQRELLVFNRDKEINDSIIAVTYLLESSRGQLLASVTSSIDKSGKRALDFGAVLIGLVLAGGTGLFWFIINTIRKQGDLISQLNVSERKVKASAQIKENFMANMSHEIRTPMNAILGFTHLLQTETLQDQSKEYVKAIEKSGENLLSIVNDILDFSKIEAGMMRMETATFNIRELIQSIETMFYAKTREKNIPLKMNVDESLPELLQGDATRLSQILVNLIGNAFKFTTEGAISVSLTHLRTINADIQVGISVCDTGIGIDEKKLETIFQRFQQAEDAVTRKYGGTGLGLSIVQELVLLQRGHIKVESKLGKGSCFHLMIPYQNSPAPNEWQADLANEMELTIPLHHIHVLVAEDNEVNQNLLRHLFEKWQMGFYLAKNGSQAIEMLREREFDLVLMDIQMPEMDGYSAAQQIRHVLHLDIPIIAMTAHALYGERDKCLSYGMNEYISKPIRVEELHRLIAQFVKTDTQKQTNPTPRVGESSHSFRYIQLQYMKEVSGGSTEYEQTITQQFIESIPLELGRLQSSWQNGQIDDVRRAAHHMKTTLSVMGLNRQLDPFLDILEYGALDHAVFIKNFNCIKTICDASLEEAKQFLSSL